MTRGEAHIADLLFDACQEAMGSALSEAAEAYPEGAIGSDEVRSWLVERSRDILKDYPDACRAGQRVQVEGAARGNVLEM